MGFGWNQIGPVTILILTMPKWTCLGCFAFLSLFPCLWDGNKNSHIWGMLRVLNEIMHIKFSVVPSKSLFNGSIYYCDVNCLQIFQSLIWTQELTYLIAPPGWTIDASWRERELGWLGGRMPHWGHQKLEEAVLSQRRSYLLTGSAQAEAVSGLFLT
jgi:hypothetical protein